MPPVFGGRRGRPTNKAEPFKGLAERIVMDKETVIKELKVLSDYAEGWKDGGTAQIINRAIELLQATEPLKSVPAVVSPTGWDTVKKFIEKKYGDKPDDFILSIGHWSEGPSGLPEFNAYLQIKLGDIRKSG